MKPLQLNGIRFSNLVAKEFCGKNKHNQTLWKCLCDCGNTVVRSRNSLKKNRLVSCGCFLKTFLPNINTKHKMSKSPEYRAYRGMLNRCYRKKERNYESYGGRGIVVCDKWKESFVEFLKDVGQRPSENHSIDRINNDGNYEPGNVKWSTTLEQSLNRRKKRNTSSKYRGVSFYKNKNCWVAKIAINRKKYHLGYFKSEDEAALAYNEEAKALHGSLAKLNIIT